MRAWSHIVHWAVVLREWVRSQTVRAYALLISLGLLGVTLNLGDAGLWDPWETHYGEVARNIITRADPMDLRYKPGYGPDGRRENQFRSKPVLAFWGMAAGLWVFDVGDAPEPDEMVATTRPLWALRIPGLAMAIWGIAALARALHRAVSPRAGWTVAWVLATMPQFLMLARQATTDVYALGPMCVALGAWIEARYGPDRALRTRVWGRLRLPIDVAFVRFVGLFALMVGVPIAVLWRHVTRTRVFEMVSNWPRRSSLPTVQDLEQIASVMSGYALAAAVVLGLSMFARRRRALHMYTVYLAAGWALLGKGLLVPGLLGVVCGVDLIRGWRTLKLRELNFGVGIGLFVLAFAPWHHAMAIFRKNAWIHELVVVNNLERFFLGEQADAVGQLGGYLWVLAAAMGVWVFVWPPAPQIRSGVFRFAGTGALLTLAVLSASATVYDHYAAVCLPLLALVITGWLQPRAESGVRVDPWFRGLHMAALTLLATFLGLTLWREPARMVHLTSYLATGMWRQGAGAIGAYLVVLMVAWALRMAQIAGVRAVKSSALMACAMLSGWVLMLQYIPQSSTAWSQAKMLHVYFEQRQDPDEIGSWWFYHRGETFYTKRRIWVLAQPDPKALRDKIEQMRGKGGDLWLVTTPLHLPRLREHLPQGLRPTLDVAWTGDHQVLVRLPLRGTSP